MRTETVRMQREDLDNLVHLGGGESGPAACLHQLRSKYKKDLIYVSECWIRCL